MIDNISRQDAINAALDCKVKYNGEISDAVLNMITTEIAESIKIIPAQNDNHIVRCIDCKYGVLDDEFIRGSYYCMFMDHHLYFAPDFYCKGGEPRS